MNLDDTSRQIRIHVDEFRKMASGLIFKLRIDSLTNLRNTTKHDETDS